MHKQMLDAPVPLADIAAEAEALVLKVEALLSTASEGVLLREGALAVLAIALPAVMTQIPTPVAQAFVTRGIAPFGDDAVAGWAVIGRITPSWASSTPRTPGPISRDGARK